MTQTASGDQRTGRLPRLSWTVLLLTSVAVAVYVPFQNAGASLHTLVGRNTGLAPTYAVRPWPVQLAFHTHITFAGLTLLVGPSPSRAPFAGGSSVHRTIGRVYLTSFVVELICTRCGAFWNSQRLGPDGYDGMPPTVPGAGGGG